MPIDGEYEVELVWQYQQTVGIRKGTWNTFLDQETVTESHAPCRQVYIIQPAESGKEQNDIHILDLSEFSINLQDVERAFCYGYLTNPENDALDNADLMRKWELFKNNYLEPRYGQ